MSVTTTGRSASGTTTSGLPGARSKTVAEDSAEAAAQAAEAAEQKTRSAGSSFAELKKRSEERAQAAQTKAEAEDESLQADKLSAKERRALAKAAKNLDGEFTDYPHLNALRPKERYAFHSDYFQIDQQYATVMSFFHDEAARDDFGHFWGINRITSGLDDRVTTVILEQVRRRGEKWITDRMKTSDKLDKLESDESDGDGATKTSKLRQRKVSRDMEVITEEIQNGSSYLHVHLRMLVKAPSLAVLDDSVERIKELYVDRFGTLKVAPYHGEQRQELTKILDKNANKRGKGFGFTSTELAGSHSLVTNGLNDPTGEYVGYMVGDVNNSAVLFDVDAYDRRVVVADEEVSEVLGRELISDMWGSKISQAAMLANKRVVHIVLDGADMDRLGPRFENITARMDMNSGDINLFEIFGERKDMLSLFPAHLEKVVLMAEQAYESGEGEGADGSARAIIRGSLKEILTQFYIDKGMWARNAPENRERLRVVGIPHDQVPRLRDLVSYFNTEYEAEKNAAATDENVLQALSVLRFVFKDLLDNNGDLFNTHTNSEIDSVAQSQRVLYDFSRLMKRGKGVAMAQLVNTIGFAVDSLGYGDTVIIHGTERIAKGVKEYIETQFEHLFHRGGRVAFLYNDVEKMFDDEAFNKFDAADYTILGPMREALVEKYQKIMHQNIPPDLRSLLTARGEGYSYLRRGHSNVVFYRDIPLGINAARRERREELLAMADQIRGSKGSSDRGGVGIDSGAGSLEEINRRQQDAMKEEKPRMKRRRRKRRGPDQKMKNQSSAGSNPTARMTRKR